MKKVPILPIIFLFSTCFIFDSVNASFKNSGSISNNITEVCSEYAHFNETSNECVCNRGYTGENCNYILCASNDDHYKQCKNSGICMKNVKTSEYMCKCNQWFTGALCEIPQGLNYCYNGGYYESNNSKCQCQDRYNGRRCEFDICIKEVEKCQAGCYLKYKKSTNSCQCLCNKDCDDNYCNKNGHCTIIDGDLSCKCNSGYSGTTCAINKCKGYCFNGGKCVLSKFSNKVSCKCPDGFRSDERCGIKDVILIKRTKKPEPVPVEFRSTRIIMYALSLTLFICLVSIGGYIAIQRGLFSFIFGRFHGDSSSLNSSYTRGNSTFDTTNLNFKKLEEDNQSVVENYAL